MESKDCGNEAVKTPQDHTGRGASLRVPARRIWEGGTRKALATRPEDFRRKAAVAVEANVFAAVLNGQAVFGE